MALENPFYAYAGAIAAPVAVGTLARFATPSPGLLIGGLAATALVGHYYAGQMRSGSPGESFAEGVALSTGPLAVVAALAYAMNPAMLRA